jgi:hypothetical protein
VTSMVPTKVTLTTLERWTTSVKLATSRFPLNSR